MAGCSRRLLSMPVKMWRSSMPVGVVLAACGPVLAAEIWKSTFDTDADGVVDIYDNNPAKQMIGPAAGGDTRQRGLPSLAAPRIVDAESIGKAGTGFAHRPAIASGIGACPSACRAKPPRAGSWRGWPK